MRTQLPELVLGVLFGMAEELDVLDELHAIVVQSLYLLLLPDLGSCPNDFKQIVRKGTVFPLA